MDFEVNLGFVLGRFSLPVCSVSGYMANMGVSMKSTGPKHERETIVRWDEEGPDAEIWTASQLVYNRLLKRGFELIEEGGRHGVFKCLKKQVKFSLLRPASKGILAALVKARAAHGFPPVRTRGKEAKQG